MFIGIACTIPDLPNLPGQGGEDIAVTLDYPSSDVCYDGTTSPSDASPVGGVFSYTGSGTLDLNTSTGAINAAGSDSGSYTVIYTKSGVSSSFPIVIGNDITLSITPVPGATICTGDTATLTANASGGTGTITYSWSTGATTQAIDVTASGTYTVTVTDSNGCTAQASQAITASTDATTIASVNNDYTMTFNGTDQYVDANYNSLNFNSGMSISSWFKWDGSTVGTGDNSISIISRWSANSYFGSNGKQFLLRLTNATPNIQLLVSSNGSSNTIYTGSTSITSGIWHHVAVTWDTNTYKVILNGNTSNPEISQSNTNAPFNTTTTPNIVIGATYGNSAPSLLQHWAGSLDEVAIWDSALSSCDIKGIYEGSIGSNAGKAANLLDANTTIPAPVYWNRMGDS
jgi:hypothetical protein